jgi:hypothetical protein
VTPAADSQQVAADIEAELERRGLTMEEVRRQAETLGLDLNDPQQAAVRARELGVPEWQIEQFLRASQARASAPVRQPFVPTVLEPDTVLVRPGASPRADRLAPRADTVLQRDTTTVPTTLPFFGYDTFQSGAAVELPAIGSIDEAYVVGPGDELRLTLTGAAEFQVDLTVDAEGRIFVPSVGQYTAGGQRLGELRERVRRFLSRSYAGLFGDPPSTFMDLTLTRLRPVQVFVTGAVERPGAYTVPSGTSVFNVL